MYFKQILNERCGCASYVIASRKTLEAAVVDAASDTEPYSALLHERGFRLRFVIDTHIHADHVSGARRLAAAPTSAISLTKRLLNASPDSDRAQAFLAEAMAQEIQSSAEDSREGIRSFVERRQPEFRGW